MKLKYTAKRTITTADLFDAADPPIIFEVRTRMPAGWPTLNRTFEEGEGKDIDMARQLVAGAFLTVTQDDTDVYPLDTVEMVKELEKAIELDNPGFGEEFTRKLALAFSFNHYRYLENNLGNLLEPLAQSNANGEAKIPA